MNQPTQSCPRRRFNYSNVMSTLAVFLAMTGTAVATHPGGTNTINTGDIQNGQVFTQDLADNNLTSLDVRDDTLGSGGLQAQDLRADSVGTSEVTDNSLTGDDVDELSLAQVPSAALGGIGRSAGAGSCSPGPDLFTCKFVSITLPSPSRVLIIGAANAWSPDASAQGTCLLATDLGDMGNTSMPVIVDNTSLINLAGHSISISGVTPPMTGAHDFGIRCKEEDGDIKFSNVQVSAVALSAN